MTQPLPIRIKLSGNPQKEPQFSVPLKAKAFPNSNLTEEVLAADPNATRAMIALMDMSAVLGGAASHYGGPAAFAELMSALHAHVFTEARIKNTPWYELYNLVNDAGHCENGLYALKANYGFANLDINDLKKFRSIESKLTGHGESHLFPEGVLLSNGPLGSAFPQSQGLAMADSLAGKKRVTITALSDGASMEGEAREAFAAIPGLAKAGKLSSYVLIISDNNTKLTGRIDKDSFSMEPSFQSLSTLGWKVISIEDGHDLQKCFDVISEAIEDARLNPKVPIAIHAKTIKGIGTKKTAESSSGGHGFPLKSPTELKAFISEIYDSEKYPEVFDKWIEELILIENQNKSKSAQQPKIIDEKIQKGVSAALIKAKKAGLPIVSITSDLPGSTGMAEFRKEFPAESFDVGVAESNMISTAAGFSRMGFIPVVDTFAQFGVTKGALPLMMASLSDSPMICVFSHTGFQDAADGASHQALSYLAMTASIPHCELICLSCSDEAEALVFQAVETFAKDRQEGREPKSYIFFLGRENFLKNFGSDISYKLNKAQVLFDNSNSKTESVTIIASGSLVPQAIKAAADLEKRNTGAIVINPVNHNHPDLETISNALKKTKGRMIVVEDHQRISGLGQLLTAELMTFDKSSKIKLLSVKEQFGQSAYNAIDLYRKHGLDSDSIVRNAIELL